MPSRQISSTGWQGCSYDSANQRECLKYFQRCQWVFPCVFFVVGARLLGSTICQNKGLTKQWESLNSNNRKLIADTPKSNEPAISFRMSALDSIYSRKTDRERWIQLPFLGDLVQLYNASAHCDWMFLVDSFNFSSFQPAATSENHEVLSSNHDTKKRKQNNASFSFFLGGGRDVESFIRNT